MTAPSALSYTPAVASALTGLGIKDLFRAIHSGELPAKKKGPESRQYLIRATDLDAFIASLPDAV